MAQAEVNETLRLLGLRAGSISRNWMTLPCPLAPWTHAKGTDRTPSFGIFVAEGERPYYYCQSCHHGGDLFSFARKLLVFRDQFSVPLLAEIARVQGSVAIPDFEARAAEDESDLTAVDPARFSSFPYAEEDEIAMEYLASRGVTASAAVQLDLRYHPEHYRVLFPVYDAQHNLYGMTGRGIFPEIQPKVKDYLGLPKRRLLLGMQLVRHTSTILLVEGLIALARIVSIRDDLDIVPLAVMGSTLTDPQAELLKDFARPVVLAPDLDEAGEVFLHGITEHGQHTGGGAIDKLRQDLTCSIGMYPEGVDDLDDFTKDDLRYLVENASLVAPY